MALFGGEKAAGLGDPTGAPGAGKAGTEGAEVRASQGEGASWGEEQGGAGSGEVVVEITAVLDRIFEAVCRPFKVRVEQVLVAGQPGLVLAYKLCNLLEFYYHTVRPLTVSVFAASAVLWRLNVNRRCVRVGCPGGRLTV